MPQIKNIYATITDHVQMVGYREIVEIHAKARGLAGFVFNDVDGSVKLMVSGPDAAINDFVDDLKAERPDTVIEVLEIVEDIKLPSPFGRIVIDETREISERLDKGNRILGEMNTKLDKLGTLDEMSNKLGTLDEMSNKLGTLDEMSNKLGALDEMSNKLGALDEMSNKLDALDGINNKLDTLPERIAEALRR